MLTLLLGGLTPWLGLLAAALALFGGREATSGTGAALLAGGVALVAAVGGVAWHRRSRRERGNAADAPLRRRHDGRPVRAAGGGCGVESSPAALDIAEVLEAVRARFIRLQAAWDAGDVAALAQLTTPDMLAELLQALSARGAEPSRTDVLSLHAELLELEEFGAAYLASIEFSGLIRESAARGAVPFRELWMLASAKGGAPSWRLARQQALF